MKRANIKYLLTFIIILISLSLLAGCQLLPDRGSSPTTTTTTTTTTPTPTPINPSWTLPPAEGQAPILPSIADVVAKIKPSVVAINTEMVTYDIFNQPLKEKGAGSGWIIREDGIIITNNHVVAGALSITVTLDDGRTFPVEINKVAADPLTDLAVLKIEAKDLPTATMGDSSKLRVGDWVVAIGNALGEGITAKEGIISRLKVSIQVSQNQTLYNLLETSAAINPGNSGGPLVNMAGEIIGITNAKIAQVGVEGMGYAISGQEAVPIIQELVNTGYVIRPWLGVGLYTVDQFVAFRYNLAVDKGAFVVNVAVNSPADKAGLREGDIIDSFNGEEITSAQEVTQAIQSLEIGQRIKIGYWRGNTQRVTYATLAETPPPG